jgi:hypothetical protein
MSRNRLKNSHSLHWMGVLKWILILGLLAVLGLVYMLGKNQNLHLAQQTYQLRVQLDAINQVNTQLNFSLDQMKSPRALERRLAQNHSTLVPLSQMIASVVQMNSGTLMRIERIGTPPIPVNYSTTSSVNLNPHVAATGTSADSAAPQPGNQ